MPRFGGVMSGAIRPGHARRLLASERYLFRQRVENHLDVSHRSAAKISRCGAPAPSTFGRRLDIAGADLRGALKIVVPRTAQPLRCRVEGLAEQMFRWQVGHRPRTADPVIRPRAPLLILTGLEE